MIKRLFLKIKYRARYFINPKVWSLLSSGIIKFREFQYLEKFKSYGNLHPDKTFYIIRRRPPAWGLFSNIFYVVQGILYAEEKGFIPVVDMENYWVGELSEVKKINETRNAWCYLFQQISDYNLSEVYKSKNVVLSNGYKIFGHEHWLELKNRDLIMNPRLLKLTKEILSKYINLNHMTIAALESAKKRIEWDGGKTLGIFVRGGNYYLNAGTKLTDIPKYEYLLSNIYTMALTAQVSRIFICTEDFRFYNKLSRDLKEFNIVQSIRYPENLTLEEWQKDQKLTFDNSILMGYEKSLKYLIEILLLSECKYTISTNSNASIFALIMNDINCGEHKLLFNDQVLNLGEIP